MYLYSWEKIHLVSRVRVKTAAVRRGELRRFSSRSSAARCSWILLVIFDEQIFLIKFASPSRATAALWKAKAITQTAS
ncbi:hypothetical protein RRG08_011959 [Elysia crispata]|uniref:Uncharacterized protein n=1 Tax=Elysia crispata TaxID=231223 RepID=A0AAE1AT16_9GAST|nr:hypothetical protein RRG08_011959 [Elysia crispata]